ncbi:MAG: HipA domain-containing protein [Legionella sp.]|jgi:serine/threonine-protein kinase HipA
MTKLDEKDILVYADWIEIEKPLLIGILNSSVLRGKEIFAFEYDSLWLNNRNIRALDPSLQLFKGRQFVPQGHSNFGLFLDSSPDRWGRFLMKRREAHLAREEKRPERRIFESDYLLGVHDEYRMGGIRFKLNHDGSFLDDNEKMASPPMTSLRELEQASLAIESKDSESSKDYGKWLKMLIAPGGSLGGARPKASVIDGHNQLWIAKFPSRYDDIDVGAWEMLAYQLGKSVGIEMAEAKLKRFNSENHTFLSKRFDRTQGNNRVHFASAMTLLQRKDGDDAASGVSYLHLAEFLMREGAEPDRDLQQLWQRILFFVCISNVDDHLRNHGFLLQDKGWVLSPAYDINPVPYSDGLKLNISESDNTQSLELVKSVAPFFRISKNKADALIDEMLQIIKVWRKKATQLGISQTEQARMASAFRVTDN